MQRKTVISSSRDEDNGARHSTSSSLRDEDDNKYKEPIFRYADLLVLSLSPSVLVLLAFGGRPSLVAICFGSLFSYIFDILGAMEATVLCVVVALMGVWGTLLYSARHLLEESLMNVALFMVLSIVLLLVFFGVGGMFRGLRIEFDGVFYFMETFMFAVIPLINSSVVSWFVSVEFPMMDLGLTFCSCYYLFLVVLAYPRVCSHPMNSQKNKKANKFVLPFPVLYSMYIVPIVMSPILYLSLHHNVSMTSINRLVGMVVAVFYPIVLVILAAERHTDYYPEESRKAVSNFLFIGKVFSALGMVILLQSHDIIEEIKFFSGLAEPFASLSIIFSAGLLLLSALLKNLKKTYDTDALLEDESDVMGRPVSAYAQAGVSPVLLTSLIEGCYTVAVLMAYVILGILSPTQEPRQAMITVVSVLLGCWSLAEYYEQQKQTQLSVDFGVQIKNAFCILAAGTSSAYGMHLFTSKHLQFLDFTLEWSFGAVTLQSLCTFSAVLTGAAVMIPAILYSPRESRSHNSSSLGFVPSQGDNGSGSLIDVKTAENYASLMFVFFSIAMSGFELLIREQDWSEVAGGASSSDVYPAYFLAATAVLFIITTLHLCSIEAVGIATLWIIGLTQCCKMLHLVDFSSEICFCILSLLVSLTQPFVLYLRDGWKEINNTAADVVNGVGSSVVWAPRIGFMEGLWYIVMCGLSCDLASRTFLPMVLVEFTGREVTVIQSHALGWSFWCFFCAAMSFCFLREATMVRSFLCLAGGLCFMVAGNALGTLNITYDPSSPFMFSIQLLEDAIDGDGDNLDHGGIFAVLTAILGVASFLGLMPLKTVLQRLLYLFCFSYCGAMACFHWVFPESAASHGSVVSLDVNAYFSFPWLLCLLSVFLSTSTVLHISSSGAGGGWMLTLSASVPIAFTCIAVFTAEHEHYLANTFFLNMGVQSATAVCSRIVDFSRQHDPSVVSSRANANNAASSSFAETVCMITSVLAFSFGVMHSLFSRHVICDFAVPALSVLLATSKEFGWSMSGYISALYWTCSALYSFFIKDYNGLEFLHEFATPLHGQKGIFADADLSIWSEDLSQSGYAWLTWIHVLLLLMALGPIVMTYYRGSESPLQGRGHSSQQRGQYDGSDDLLFVLSIVAVVPILTAQLWSVRLLGVLGVTFGVCNAYHYGHRQRRSDVFI